MTYDFECLHAVGHGAFYAVVSQSIPLRRCEEYGLQSLHITPDHKGAIQTICHAAAPGNLAAARCMDGAGHSMKLYASDSAFEPVCGSGSGWLREFYTQGCAPLAAQLAPPTECPAVPCIDF